MTYEEFRARLPEGSKIDRALFDKCSESEREFLVKHEWLHELTSHNYTMKEIDP